MSSYSSFVYSSSFTPSSFITFLTLLYAGVSINAYTRGGGSKSPDSVKSITGREILCKNDLFYVLNGVFGHV